MRSASVEKFGAQDLANIAWAFARAGHLDEKLFAALASAAQIAESDPKAIFALKSLMNDGGKHSLGDALELEGERSNAFATNVNYRQMESRLIRLRRRATTKAMCSISEKIQQKKIF